MPIGVRSTSPVGIGNMVIVSQDTNDTIGTIQGIVPTLSFEPSLYAADWISQGSTNGFKRDSAHHALIRWTDGEGGVQNFNNSSPMDATALGEWGKVTENGTCIFLDSFSTYMRVNEICGVFFNYFDNHTRLAGWNLDIETGATETIIRCDEGENQVFHGETPYPWESGGTFSADTSISEEQDDKDVQFNKPVGKYEPDAPDVVPIWRYAEYGGYLGQGKKRLQSVPPNISGSNKLSDAENVNTDSLGVFEENISLDGHYSLRSAKAITIAKRAGVVPRRKKIAEDRTGDDRENGGYRFAGKGDGPEHKIGDIKSSSGAENPHLIAVAAALDLHAFTFNWKGVHPFHYHVGDFRTPEESEGQLKSFEAPSFNSLRGEFFLPRPDPVEVKVDDRYGDVQYFANESYISMLDDGGIVIGDGYGAELRMTGGHIYITAPGDISVLPGRSAHIWGGDDVIVRAKNSVDLTATNKDVRVKAKNNVEIFSKERGVLIEGGGTGTQLDYENPGEAARSAGVLLRAPNSSVFTMAQQIYLRTGSESGSTISNGDIILDAARGTRNIISHASSSVRYLRQSAADVFGAPENPSTLNFFNATSANIESSLRLGGQAIINAQGNQNAVGLLVVGSMAQKGKNIANLSGGLIGELDANTVGQIDSQLNDVNNQISDEVSRLGDIFTSFFDDNLYADGGLGNEEIQQLATFSFRTEEQYNSESFQLPESRWAQVARFSQQTLETWEEDPVVKGPDTLYPFPGTKFFKSDEGAYLQFQELKLFDAENGYAKNRGGENNPYEDAELAELNKVSLNEYPTIF